MKELEVLMVTDNKDYIKSSNGFQDNDGIDDDIVIIQLIVQGRPINVSEDLLVEYSKYFWNLFQNLPPSESKQLGRMENGKMGKYYLPYVSNNLYITPLY